MAKRDDYEVRIPSLDELGGVQKLRHAELDPARVRKSDVVLSDDDFNDKNIHMAAFLGADVVSTLRVDRLDDSRYEVVKVATAKAHRLIGLGKSVLLAAEYEATKRGAAEFVLSSRIPAIPFYEKLGYKLDGSEFESQDGVINRWMVKQAVYNGQ